ncbi:MAG: hypothetical protein P4L74_01170 [Candidatus Doudnabacteria bacterium]|nr:hypothetical protein [Candidatus Doudnabacteria bacterium]
MITYEKIKTWYKQKENKDKVMLGISFVLVFLVGFGTGNYSKGTRPTNVKSQTNYTTSQAKIPAAKPAATSTLPAAKPAVAGAATTTANCLIKGNISTGGRKLYHVPGGASYKVVKPEQCFNTEAEALAAGFAKSGR